MENYTATAVPEVTVPTRTDDSAKIKCKFKGIIYVNKDNGYTVARYYSGDFDSAGFILGAFVAVGYFLPCNPATEVLLTGTWEERVFRGQKEQQLHVTESEEILPTKHDGMVAYLSGPDIRGCGEKTAEKIVTAFGDETYAVLESPDAIERMGKEAGIPKKKAEVIVECFLAATYARECITKCAEFGISQNKAMKLYNTYGDDTMRVLKTTPYRICEIDGFGFIIADKIAQAIVFTGEPFDATSLVRIKAGVLYIMKQELTNGNLYQLDDELIKKAREILNNGGELAISDELIMKAVKSLENDAAIKIFTYKGEDINGKPIEYHYNYLPFAKKAEENVAQFIYERTRHPANDVPDDTTLYKLIETAATKINFHPSQHQIEAAMMVLKNKISIITGGPGTGKTSVIKTVIEASRLLFEKQHHHDSLHVSLAAPTGRAARRMSESCGYPAQTIHALLGLRPNQSMEAVELNLIEDDLLIVDEFSMVDMFLANHLTANISSHTKIVFVGDAAQLPSVGPGSVFAELIACKAVPVTELTEIFRQKGNDAGAIIENAARIRTGNSRLIYNRNSFQLVVAEDSHQAQQFIRAIFDAELRAAGENGTDKVQVLSPRRTEVATSVQKLNPFLRDIARAVYPSNSEAPSFSINGSEFAVGDKIMQLKNTDAASNGDIGYIKDIVIIDPEGDKKDPKNYVFVIDFGEGREEEYKKKDMEDVVHAYACTIHKSQGSEYDTVIIPLLGEHSIMLERALFYTAVTRAVKRVIIVTSDNGRYVHVAVARRDSRLRNTLLSYRIATLVATSGANAE